MISFGANEVTIMTRRDRIHKFQTWRCPRRNLCNVLLGPGSPHTEYKCPTFGIAVHIKFLQAFLHNVSKIVCELKVTLKLIEKKTFWWIKLRSDFLVEAHPDLTAVLLSACFILIYISVLENIIVRIFWKNSCEFF